MRGRNSSMLVGAIVCLVLPACVIPFAVPGSRVESGGVAAIGDEGTGHGMQVKAGAHAASIQRNTAVETDYGAGYIYERYASRPEPSMTSQATTTSLTKSIHGGYVEAAKRVPWAQAPGRVFLGMRGEMLGVRSQSGTELGFGASGRLTFEFAKGGEEGFSGSDRCAIVGGVSHGTTAIGVYAEAGYRSLGAGQRSGVFTVGLSLRMPTIVGLAFVIPVPGC